MDEARTAVEGMCLKIGEDEIYSDREGKFYYRTKKPATLPIEVVTEESITPGDWVVVDAPEEVSSGKPVQIVVGLGNISISESVIGVEGGAK